MRILSTTLALALSTGLTAQVVVPSVSATKDPNYYDYMCTYGTTSTSLKNEGRGQYIYDSADVTAAIGTNSKVWKSIAWRRPHYISNTNLATTFSMQIIMSNSPVAYNSPSTTYTLNHGSSTAGSPPQMVVNANISLPANSRGTTWPEPWFTAIPFNGVPLFVHAPVKGGSLVIECIGSQNSQSRTYYCEGHQPDNGTRSSNGSSGGCQWHSDGGWNSGISYFRPVVGGQWYVQHNSMPSNEPNMKKSINIIGAQGVGGTFLGKTLPIPIASLGFLDICKVRAGVLANDLLVYQPMTYTPSTAGASRGTLRTPTVNIPNAPALGGLSFFAQPMCADKPLGGYDQIYMAWPSKWTIGTGTGPMGSTVYRTGNNTATTGYFRNGYGRTMLLQ